MSSTISWMCKQRCIVGHGIGIHVVAKRVDGRVASVTEQVPVRNEVKMSSKKDTSKLTSHKTLMQTVVARVRMRDAVKDRDAFDACFHRHVVFSEHTPHYVSGSLSTLKQPNQPPHSTIFAHAQSSSC